jgi:hypothetical protein
MVVMSAINWYYQSFFYRYGSNATVDPVVYRKNGESELMELLLMRRKVGKRWALPGGFLDRVLLCRSCSPKTAEETGLDAVDGTDKYKFMIPVGLRLSSRIRSP